MDEIGFVLKSLLVTTFAVFLLQMKVGGGMSVEGHLVSYMGAAWGTKFMQDIGKGATRMTASAYQNTLGGVIDSQKTMLGKMTDIKSEMKAVEESNARREKRLMDIENN